MAFVVRAKDVDAIEILMVKKGLLKNSLAGRATVHPNTITKLFKNKYIGPASAKKICDVLDIGENEYEDYFFIEDVSKSKQ